ncbi:hypothetical protein SCHPADRAFT_902972 [Schizopora paradoxa]|uniref:Uncharacterized protein n=1 Tax=Schizopora paradoxa TaxID=27342 RepID=A0A0H2SCZ9_9AGAM|nr:hypothetical protein SCHPADRAFT_902972 [Schizopora paradoxa]
MAQILQAKPQARPKLEFPLIPQKGPLSAAHVEKAHSFEPMYKLPSFLIPTGRYSNTRPPRFHYGWALEIFDRLYETAKELGVQPRARDEDSDDDSETEEDEEEEEELPTVSTTEIYFRDDAMTALTKHLKLGKEPYLATVFRPGKDRITMVALAENYAFKDGFALFSDMEKLTDHFKFDSEPMWYIDAYFWMWNGDDYWYS